MKKIFLLLITTMICASLFSMGVKDDADYSILNPTNVRVAALKGPTAMGMVKLMEDSKSSSVNGNSYDFTIVGAPTEITPMLVKGEVDIAALPANLAAVIFIGFPFSLLPICTCKSANISFIIIPSF